MYKKTKRELLEEIRKLQHENAELLRKYSELLARQKRVLDDLLDAEIAHNESGQAIARGLKRYNE